LTHVGWSFPQALRAISLIQLAEALPITVSGLGTRETVLLNVMGPAQSEQILAFGFAWSAGLIVGRLAIGLGILVLVGNMARARGLESKRFEIFRRRVRTKSM
jgi:uncharacterized membrane protein YbhN (UPF0104 family)